MAKFIIFACCAFSNIALLAQQRFALSGFMKDLDSGEPLVTACVGIIEEDRLFGTLTNA